MYKNLIIIFLHT